MLRPFAIRRMLALVALAALASFGVSRVVEWRDDRARAGPSEKLLRPIIEHHEWQWNSDRVCSQGNAETARGHLSRALGSLRVGIRAICRDVVLPRGSEAEWRQRSLAGNSWRTAGGEWRGFGQSWRLVAKERVMATYHARMMAYYQGLLDEHRVEIPPHPAWLVAERRAVESRLRAINCMTGVDLDPEPLPQFLPGWKAPPGRPLVGPNGEDLY